MRWKKATKSRKNWQKLPNSSGNSLLRHQVGHVPFIGHYCKLVVFGLVPIVDIAHVLRYYARCYADYGDILKQVLTRLRDMDRIPMAHAIIRTLMNVFDELRIEVAGDGEVDTESEGFSELRDLAKRLAAYFTGEQRKNREAVALIHHLGIRHALSIDAGEPTSRLRGARRAATTQEEKTTLAFLEVLQEFSPKLIRHDKVAM